MNDNARLKTGDILHIPGTGPAHDRSRGHFHVIIAEKEGAEVVLLVPICSAHEKCDKTCIISRGDHACVKHESFAMYAKLNYHDAAHLEKRINSGAVEKLEPASNDLTTRIALGVLTSSFAAPTYRKFVASFRARTGAEAIANAAPTESRAAASSPSKPG